MNESFVFYASWQEILLDYEDNIRLEVYDAVIRYASTGELSDFENDKSKMAFSFIKNQIDHNNKKYENTCQKRKEAVERRWKKKQSEQSDTNNTKDTNVSKENNSTGNDTKDTNVDFVMLYDNDNELYKSPKETMNNELSSKDANSKKNKKKTRTAKIREWIRALIAEYNNFLTNNGCALKPILQITEQRYEAITKLLEKFGTKQFGMALTHFARSPYANGKTKDRNRPVDFDWFLEEKNFVKALENSL